METRDDGVCLITMRMVMFVVLGAGYTTGGGREWRCGEGQMAVPLFFWQWTLGVGDLSSVMRMCHGGWAVSSIWIQHV
jgi:hypothetical protein